MPRETVAHHLEPIRQASGESGQERMGLSGPGMPVQSRHGASSVQLNGSTMVEFARRARASGASGRGGRSTATRRGSAGPLHRPKGPRTSPV